MFQSINPFTEEPLGETYPLSDQEMEEKLSLSARALPAWSDLDINKKIAFAQNLKELLQKEKKNLSALITKEMGKPLQQALAEVEKCAELCEYASKQAPLLLKDKTNLPFAPKNSYISFQPLGLILGIMPWNFPFWQVFRFALPVSLGGNAVLIKHAPNVMLCALELEKLFIKAGFPLGVYQNLPISLEQTKKALADQRIRGVSLTGSVKAGRAVSALAGRYLKKTVLELGGSDPYIILDSANLKIATRECVLSRMNNSGQSCIAAKRFIVTQKNAEEFSALVVEKMKSYKMENPILPGARLGPLARKDLREHLHSQTTLLMEKGAEALLGANIPRQKGYFYPPTVLKCDFDLPAGSFEEELFGPVALIIIVSNEKEALRTANSSVYGLGAAIFSQDTKKAEKWARDYLQAGSCMVNQALRSHPALPFGGIKDSGYGRELSSYGFYEFLNIKTISVDKS